MYLLTNEGNRAKSPNNTERDTEVNYVVAVCMHVRVYVYVEKQTMCSYEWQYGKVYMCIFEV